MQDAVRKVKRTNAIFKIDEKWGVNAGLYWIDIDTKAAVYVNGDKATEFDVEIDPMVYRLNVVYKL